MTKPKSNVYDACMLVFFAITSVVLTVLTIVNFAQWVKDFMAIKNNDNCASNFFITYLLYNVGLAALWAVVAYFSRIPLVGKYRSEVRAVRAVAKVLSIYAVIALVICCALSLGLLFLL